MKGNRKSVRVGLVCYLLPGAGMIYARKVATGVLYVVTVIVLFFTPLWPLIVVVVLLSYGHTAVAILNWNQRAEENELPTGALIPPPPFLSRATAFPPSTSPSQITAMSQVGAMGRSCSRCGGKVSQTARYCKTCGQLLDQTQVWQ